MFTVDPLAWMSKFTAPLLDGPPLIQVPQLRDRAGAVISPDPHVLAMGTRVSVLHRGRVPQSEIAAPWRAEMGVWVYQHFFDGGALHRVRDMPFASFKDWCALPPCSHCTGTRHEPDAAKLDGGDHTLTPACTVCDGAIDAAWDESELVSIGPTRLDRRALQPALAHLAGTDVGISWLRTPACGEGDYLIHVCDLRSVGASKAVIGDWRIAIQGR